MPEERDAAACAPKCGLDPHRPRRSGPGGECSASPCGECSASPLPDTDLNQEHLEPRQWSCTGVKSASSAGTGEQCPSVLFGEGRFAVLLMHAGNQQIGAKAGLEQPAAPLRFRADLQGLIHPCSPGTGAQICHPQPPSPPHRPCRGFQAFPGKGRLAVGKDARSQQLLCGDLQLYPPLPDGGIASCPALLTHGGLEGSLPDLALRLSCCLPLILSPQALPQALLVPSVL